MSKRKAETAKPGFVDSSLIETKAQSTYNLLVMQLGLESAETVLVLAHKKCMEERRRRANLEK